MERIVPLLRAGQHARAAVVISATLSVTTLIGCQAGRTTAGHGGPSTASQTSVAPAKDQTAAPSSTAPNGPPLAQAVATVDEVTGETVFQPSHYRVSVYDLRRSGGLLTLDFAITCLSPSCNTEFDFAAPQQWGSSVQTPSLSTAGGIVLVDRAGRKEYRAVTDSSSRPDSAKLAPNIDRSKRIYQVYVKFAAPPATAAAMDVLFPAGGAEVPDVPVTDGPAPSADRLGPDTVPASPAPFDKAADSTDISGLNLPVLDLVSLVGNPTASDAESGNHTTLTLNADVLFEFDKSNLTPAAQGVLGAVGARIKSSARGVVTITGYTDSIGPDSVNGPLSQARAQSVVNALTPLVAGAPVTLQATGRGAADPVAPNTKPDGSDNPAGRALNRRVTVSYAVAAPVAPAPPTPAAPPPSAAPANVTKTVDYPANDGLQVSDYQVTVDSVSRSGPFAVLGLTISCQKVTPLTGGSDHCNGEADFAGTASAPPWPEDRGITPDAYLDAAGVVYLADPASGMQFVVVHDSAGMPLTAALDPDVKPNDTYPLWLYFPAPPPTVNSISVILPGANVRVDGVAISDHSSPVQASTTTTTSTSTSTSTSTP